MIGDRAVRLAAAILVAGVLAWAGPASADDGEPIDIDSWQAQLGMASPPRDENADHHVQLGIYPGLSAVLGLPDLVSAQANLFVSVADAARFSAFVGYGVEWGAPADAQIFTLGWGSVTSVPTVSRQWGFYGKFLRYRRWDDRNHGVHHGLSVGTESAAGYLGLTFEIGMARSDRNHWMPTAQIALKLALPIAIPLTRADE